MFCIHLYTIKFKTFIYVNIMFTIQVYHKIKKITAKMSKKAKFKVKAKPFNITFIILNGFI